MLYSLAVYYAWELLKLEFLYLNVSKQFIILLAYFISFFTVVYYKARFVTRQNLSHKIVMK